MSPEPLANRPVEPAWLSEQLGCEVVGLEEELIGQERGFLSTTRRLHLRTDPVGSGPASVVFKCESGDPLFQGVARERRAFEREVGFYRDLAAPLVAHVPHVYGAECGEEPWLLLEDIPGLRPGDQVRGLSLEEAPPVLRRIAAVHAHHWLDPVLPTLDWLPAQSFWFHADPQAVLEPFLGLYGLRLGDEAASLLRRTAERWEELQATIAASPWTLVHGDLRADNLLFGPPDFPRDCCLLDWQTATLSMGCLDVAYLIGGSEPVLERQGHLDELLGVWHAELMGHGVRDYTLADARHDLQLGALHCLAVVLRMGKRLLRDEAPGPRAALLYDAMIQRHTAAALELGAGDALG